MPRILIAGSNTIVGANLSAGLSGHATEPQDVCAVSLGDSITIDGCESRTVAADAGPVASVLDDVSPARVVYCGAASESTWTTETLSNPKTEQACLSFWSEACAERDLPLTYISSDAVFTGPWIFHQEDDPHHCPSPEATLLRGWEKSVTSICPDALLLRTNAYGWSPTASGWVERWIDQLGSRSLTGLDGSRHATPMLATDLVPMLLRAWEEHLTGLYHVAGAERVSPTRFARTLASEFDLPFPLSIAREELTSRPVGFSQGETSLQTRKIRRELCIAMPTLSEGLSRLREQQENGYRDRFRATTPPPALPKVA